VVAVLVAVSAAPISAGPVGASGWLQPNANISGTRASASSPITAGNVARLRPLWRFRFRDGSTFGSFASTPLVVGGTVFLQDLSSSVYALDARTGTVRWALREHAPNDGPNGLAVVGSRIFGATDTSLFALDRRTGRRLWSRFLVSRYQQFMNIAPLAADGLVFTSTVGLAPGGHGELYALDQRTGKIRWRFNTIAKPWAHPSAGGGGAWYTPSVAPDGRLYVGIANPQPWGGSPRRPNGGMYPGPVLYTDALVVLNAGTGKLLWHDQVTRHDVRDYDLEASPVLVGNVVYGAGKAGRVVAWNGTTGKRLWARAVGTHLHDLGPLPPAAEEVCPGLWGGVLTPMAYADARLFVPVVERCMRESAVHPAPLASLTHAHGVVVALASRTGRKLWSRALGSPATGCVTVANNVVFVPTYDGHVEALQAATGTVLWRVRERAGIIGCTAVAGNLLLVGAGAPYPMSGGNVRELIAYSLPRHS
jgi:outer membrane protein assembly factor BamB